MILQWVLVQEVEVVLVVFVALDWREHMVEVKKGVWELWDSKDGIQAVMTIVVVQRRMVDFVAVFVLPYRVRVRN